MRVKWKQMERIEWKCNSCGETLQGVIDRDGDFISDKELEHPARLRSVGCYLCGNTEGKNLGPAEA